MNENSLLGFALLCIDIITLICFAVGVIIERREGHRESIYVLMANFSIFYLLKFVDPAFFGIMFYLVAVIIEAATILALIYYYTSIKPISIIFVASVIHNLSIIEYPTDFAYIYAWYLSIMGLLKLALAFWATRRISMSGFHAIRNYCGFNDNHERGRFHYRGVL